MIIPSQAREGKMPRPATAKRLISPRRCRLRGQKLERAFHRLGSILQTRRRQAGRDRVLHPVGSVVGMGRGAGDWGMRIGEIGRWERVALPLRPWECFTEWLALGASIREKKSREWRFSPVELGMELGGRQFGTAGSGQVFQFRMKKIFWTMQRMTYTSNSRLNRKLIVVPPLGYRWIHRVTNQGRPWDEATVRTLTASRSRNPCGSFSKDAPKLPTVRCHAAPPCSERFALMFAPHVCLPIFAPLFSRLPVSSPRNDPGAPQSVRFFSCFGSLFWGIPFCCSEAASRKGITCSSFSTREGPGKNPGSYEEVATRTASS
jgi:hypothetical protein